MDWFKPFIKYLSDKTLRLILYIVKLIFFIMPFYIIMLIALQFFTLSPEKKFSNEQYKIIFASIGITATLSGLSFRAGNSCNENDKRNIYYYQGQRLLYATLLFVSALPLAYIYNEMHLINELSLVAVIKKNINLDIASLINGTCFVFAYFFFNFGLLMALVAFRSLNKLLWKEKLLE